MGKIYLNFLRVAEENENFEFKVYRQLYVNQEKRQDFYVQMMPEHNNLEDWKRYYFSFRNQGEGFEEFFLTSQENPEIAKLLLKEKLIEKSELFLKKDTDYFIEEKGFTKQLQFVINSYPEGWELISIEPYYLKVEKKIGFLIDFHFKESKKAESEYEYRKILQYSLTLDSNGKRSNVNFYSDKSEKYSYFIEKYLKDLNLFEFNIEQKKIVFNQKLHALPIWQTLESKKYIFDLEDDTKSSSSQFKGIENFGPLKNIEKHPLFIVIFENEYRDHANEFFLAITGRAYPKTFSGFHKFFKTAAPLGKEDFKAIVVKSYALEDLKPVQLELEKYKHDFPDRNIIGIFIEHNKEYYKQHKFEFSPYYYLKYIFIKERLPLQAITVEKMKSYDGLKWSISNIALGIFSKLGGSPWKLLPRNEDCLIFGINKCHRWNKIQKKIDKYFAYCVCLNSSGLYEKLDVLSSSNNEDEYLFQLETNIKKVISETLKKKPIKKCVLHLPFKIKFNEIEKINTSINNLVKENEQIEFQVVKINTENKFFGFAETPSKVPYESTVVRISYKEYLVWFEGLQYHTTTLARRYGNPVHIELLTKAEISENSIKDYLQDAINLSGANWRGFNSKLSPISIFYPKLIADFIAEIREFDSNFDDQISSLSTPWFL